MRAIWVGSVAIVIALVALLSLGDLLGFEAWAWFDKLGLGVVPKGIWVLGLGAIGGLAYLMDKKSDE
ncbi:hypothetical protein DZK27_16135 [Rhodobacteraceae bacterium 63075]|nr:hypothetical protein DZK27_16135 [Rhodobacteraceae bacterium 63075]